MYGGLFPDDPIGHLPGTDEIMSMLSRTTQPDGEKIIAGASLMINPVGAACNLDCAYCYYLNVQDDVYGGHAQRMSEATLTTTLRDYIAAAPDMATIAHLPVLPGPR